MIHSARLALIPAMAGLIENPQHDFPQRVIYSQEKDGVMRARIEGVRNGAPRSFEFPMRRLACAAPAGAVAR